MLVPFVVAGISSASGGDVTFQFPLPPEPIESQLFDLVTGPIDRPSAVNVVAGRGRGLPRAVRVDLTEGWDLVFAVMEGEPVWLPRGFFDGLEASSGVVRIEGTFESVTSVPGDREVYITDEPVPIILDAVYAVRSRPDPAVLFPCRVFAKLRVLSIEGDPARATFEILWNPNCDDTNVRSGGG